MVSLEEEEAQQARTAKAAVPDDGHEAHSPDAAQVPRCPALSKSSAKKYWVMTHMWLLAKIPQPSRPIFADLDETTWNNLLEELLNSENFNFRREKAQARWSVRTGTTVSSTSSS